MEVTTVKTTGVTLPGLVEVEGCVAVAEAPVDIEGRRLGPPVFRPAQRAQRPAEARIATCGRGAAARSADFRSASPSAARRNRTSPGSRPRLPRPHGAAAGPTPHRWHCRPEGTAGLQTGTAACKAAKERRVHPHQEPVPRRRHPGPVPTPAAVNERPPHAGIRRPSARRPLVDSPPSPIGIGPRAQSTRTGGSQTFLTPAPRPA